MHACLVRAAVVDPGSQAHSKMEDMFPVMGRGETVKEGGNGLIVRRFTFFFIKLKIKINIE